MNNYYECSKCGVYFIYNGDRTPSICGVFVGATVVKGEMVALGCGGYVNQISSQQANIKVEQLRS